MTTEEKETREKMIDLLKDFHDEFENDIKSIQKDRGKDNLIDKYFYLNMDGLPSLDDDDSNSSIYTPGLSRNDPSRLGYMSMIRTELKEGEKVSDVIQRLYDENENVRFIEEDWACNVMHVYKDNKISREDVLQEIRDRI